MLEVVISIRFGSEVLKGGTCNFIFVIIQVLVNLHDYCGGGGGGGDRMLYEVCCLSNTREADRFASFLQS
jgi:hypothetical protein